MKVTLPSGATAEFRDVFQRGDRREAQKGIVVIISPDGSRRMDGTTMTDVAGRVIRRMLTRWDVPGMPQLSDVTTDDLAQSLLDRLPDEDAEALEKAVGPWVERVMRRERPNVFIHVPTGVRVEPSNSADAVTLAGHPDFAAEDTGDPKTGSQATAISSSASPAPDGLTVQDSTPPISS